VPLHQRLRRRFRSHRPDGRCRRADEDEPSSAQASAKSAFSDKSRNRMHSGPLFRAASRIAAMFK
jgi:hypothetical protein